MNESTSISGTRLTLTQVAEGLNTSPQNLHKTYIKKGKLTVKRDDLDKPYIDLVEVLRVFPERFRIPGAVDPVDSVPVAKPVDAGLGGLSTGLGEVLAENASLKAQKEAAERQAADLRERLRESEARETWMRGQVDKLTDTLKLIKGPEAPQEGPKPADTAEKKPGWMSRLFGG